MNTRSPKSTARVIRSSVKDMLMEVRKILKTDQQLPFSRKILLPLPEESPLHSLSALCAQRSRPKVSKFLEKRSESKYKERLSSLAYENFSTIIPQMLRKNKMQSPVKSKIQQIKFQSYLNQDQAELVLPSYHLQSKKTKDREDFIGEKLDQSDGSGRYLSISVGSLENQEISRVRRLRTIQANNSSNLLSYLSRNRLKANPFKTKRRLKPLKLSQRLQKCEPWQNIPQNDPIFQL